MTWSSTVSIFTVMHACIFFSTLAIYGRNPDLSLTACVLQIRSACCAYGPRAIGKFSAPANGSPRVQPNVFGSQAFGTPGAAFFALQHDPKRTRDLWAAALLPQTATDASQASPVLVTVSHISSRVSILSTRHGLPPTWRTRPSTSSHPSGALSTQCNKMIIIE